MKLKPIEPYKTSLSKNNAYWMAKIASLAYSQHPDGRPNEEKIIADLKAEDENFISVTGESKNSAQAILIEHQDYFCLAFRGTDQLSDWLDNIDFRTEKALFGKFHRGFLNSVNDVWSPLFSKYLELTNSKKRPLFLTGHSLGGAMATVGAAKLIHEGFSFTAVYTFGQPRAMTTATANKFNQKAKSKFFRFHNNNDLVTRVPARLIGYSHVGLKVHITEDIKLHLEPGFWLRFLDGIKGTVNDLGEIGIDGVKDHFMEKYLSAVRKWQLVSPSKHKFSGNMGRILEKSPALSHPGMLFLSLILGTFIGLQVGINLPEIPTDSENQVWWQPLRLKNN